MKTNYGLACIVIWLSMSTLLSGQFVVQVTQSSQTPNRIAISWPTVAGKAYTVRTSIDVASGWTLYPTQPAQPVAEGALMQYEVVVDSVTRFFRVAEEAAFGAADPEALANRIVNGTTPAEVVAATQQALAAGGVTVGDVGRVDIAPASLPASWFIDPVLVFNLATEAHGRTVSGRFTLDDLGQMWEDLGFPFLGQGTPGDQLLGFLRGWLEDVASDPSATSFFTPRFIAAMVGHQDPPVSLAQTNTQPGDVRLSLLEIELLMAAFDRAFQPGIQPTSLPLVTNGPAPDLRDRAKVGVLGMAELLGGDGFCTEFKKFVGTVGSKLVDKTVGYVTGQLTTKSLKALGMTEGEIKQFNTYQKYFDAIDMAMKIIKMLQIYASTEVMLNVEGPNPVHKPHKDQARVLVPVTARAGIPDEEWQRFQQSTKSEAYKHVKDCLGSAGMPLPYDLKDIADKVASWWVQWELASSCPSKHATIPIDVNRFDGDPFKMKLAREGEASAKATLNVDIAREPDLATQFMGPVVTSKVKVKAKVFTADPPSPALVTKVTSLMGTISALVELSTGWIQTMLPPTSTTSIKVEYHDLPIAIEAGINIDMEYNFFHLREDKPEYRHTAKGEWMARLEPGKTAVCEDPKEYSAEAVMNYQSALKEKINQDPNDDCTYTYTERPFNGTVLGKVHDAFNRRGQPQPDYPSEFVMGIADRGSSPGEVETLIIRCPDESRMSRTAYSIMIGAIDALIMMDDLFLSESETSKIPGLHLDRWESQPDGTLERVLTGSKTVSVILMDGTVFDINVIRQNNVLRLRPIYAPPQ